MTKVRSLIKVFGIVQGVGFRPFIHKLVNEYGLKGWVQNAVSGVTIDVEGEEDSLRKFISDIPKKAPDLAVVEDVSFEFLEVKNYDSFSIIKSDGTQEGFVLVSPDVSICNDCYNELINPENKRYRYPFINCTNCGPRFTIIKDLPYDRDKTTMSKFPMCPECSHEYHDIENRRYHAQPNCCPECGPKLKLLDSDLNVVDGDEIKNVIEKLLEGNIVAIKGIGGFHLACDGLNKRTVDELRRRKHREEKAFAMMCRDVESIRKYSYVSESEKKLLESLRRPIVLLEKLQGCSIPDNIAPDNNRLGFMLPYTPIHYLLFEDKRVDVLVMTSANISDNPIIYENDEALNSLGGIADYFLIHNRDINTRCDDSVLEVVSDREYFIRRSRGYAPFPIKLKDEIMPILACGAEQKASFSVSRGKYVFLSQHIGDLKNYDTFMHYEKQIKNFLKLFKVIPQKVACDLHPDYMSTGYAESIENVDRVYVQHHHAHLASCMADNNLDGQVIGVTWDGTGLGTDGTSWGGEILAGGYSGFKRLGSFLKAPMPGGDRAAVEIYKMAFSYIVKAYGDEYHKYMCLLPEISHDDETTLYKMIHDNINSPQTSSCGRLFDGMAAILGICKKAGYEGQGAVRLETAIRSWEDMLEYGILNEDGLYVYDWRPTVRHAVSMLQSGKDAGYIASAFHNTLADAGIKICSMVRKDTGLNRVVLSGGVFQNMTLLKNMMNGLKKEGFDVYIHNRVSANDEGISLGQLVIAQNGGGFNVPGGSAEGSFDK